MRTDLTNLATRKFDFEDVVNADPRCPPAALKLVRAYLRFVVDFDQPVFRSTLDLRTDTALAANTIISTRNKLVALGYFVPSGRTADGVVRYRLTLAINENRVLDHLTIARETLRRMQAEKKERRRARIVTPNIAEPNCIGTANFAGTDAVVNTNFEETDTPRHCNNWRDSTSNIAPNYLDKYLKDISSEEVTTHTREKLAPLPVDDDPALAALRRAAQFNGGW